MHRRAFRAGAVRFVAHSVNAAGIDPPIVEIEKRADREGVVDGLVAEAHGVQSGDIRRTNGDGVLVHFANKTEQRLVGLVKLRRFQIGDNARYQFMIVQ